jgi:sulfonate dioxygenase
VSEAKVSVDYEPLVPFTHIEHGKDADPKLPNLLKNAKVVDLTASIGAEVHGVQLSQLTKEGKDELALFVAQKKVVGECNFLR